MAESSAPPSYHEVVTSPYQYPPPGVHYIPPGVEHPPPPVHYPPSPTTYNPSPGVHYQPTSVPSAVSNLHPGAHYSPPSPAQNLKPRANPSAPPELEMVTVNSSGVTEERLLANNTVDCEPAAATEDSKDVDLCKIQFSTDFITTGGPGGLL